MAQYAVTAGGSTLVIDGTKNSGVGHPQSGVIKNPSGSTQSVFVDLTSTVTTGTGFVLAAGDTISIDLVNTSAYVIAASGTVTVHVITRY